MSGGTGSKVVNPLVWAQPEVPVRSALAPSAPPLNSAHRLVSMPMRPGLIKSMRSIVLLGLEADQGPCAAHVAWSVRSQPSAPARRSARAIHSLPPHLRLTGPWFPGQGPGGAAFALGAAIAAR